MKTTFFFLLALLSSNFLYAQEKFKIELSWPSHLNDNIFFSPPIIRRGFEDFYNIKLNTNENIFDFGKRYGFKQSAFQIIIKEKNFLEGQFDYPQPVSFQYFNSKTKQIYLSSTFFLDSGYYKILLPSMFDAYEIRVNSPINNEYSNFKKLFSDLYIKKPDNNFDSLTSLTKKQERIGSYIKNNPNSYVAFWEIVDDYTHHGYDATYLNNLYSFSTEFKKSEVYKKFEGRLKAEALTAVGNEFPNISFDKNNSLTKKSFENYKVTFIDCWSTTCLPCIRAMPEILAMHDKYKNRSINFITITDESEPKRIELAKKILRKNNIKWTNYYDINKNFRNKLNVTSYPFQLLVDQNGKIILRTTGNLKEIKKYLDKEFL